MKRRATPSAFPNGNARRNCVVNRFRYHSKRSRLLARGFQQRVLLALDSDPHILDLLELADGKGNLRMDLAGAQRLASIGAQLLREIGERDAVDDR